MGFDIAINRRNMYGCLIMNLNSDMVDVVLVLNKLPFKQNEFIQLQLNCFQF